MIETGMRGAAAPPLAPLQPTISAAYSLAAKAASATPGRASARVAIAALSSAPQAPVAAKPAASATSSRSMTFLHTIIRSSRAPASRVPDWRRRLHPARKAALPNALPRPGPSRSRHEQRRPTPTPSQISSWRRDVPRRPLPMTTRCWRPGRSPRPPVTRRLHRPPAGLAEHLKSIIVGASVIVIIASAIHLLAGLFDSGNIAGGCPATAVEDFRAPKRPGFFRRPHGTVGMRQRAANSNAIPNAGFAADRASAAAVAGRLPPQPAASPERTGSSAAAGSSHPGRYRRAGPRTHLPPCRPNLPRCPRRRPAAALRCRRPLAARS